MPQNVLRDGVRKRVPFDLCTCLDDAAIAETGLFRHRRRHNNSSNLRPVSFALPARTLGTPARLKAIYFDKTVPRHNMGVSVGFAACSRILAISPWFGDFPQTGSGADASPEIASAWQRQPPKSISFRSQL